MFGLVSARTESCPAGRVSLDRAAGAARFDAIDRSAPFDHAVDGFLAALLDGAPPSTGLACRVLAAAGDIEARQRGRSSPRSGADSRDAIERGQELPALVLAAYRVMAGALPACELGELLRDCWRRGLRAELRAGAVAWVHSSADPFGEIAAVSRWRGLVAMFLCVAGLSGPSLWLFQRGDREAELGAARARMARDLFAAEGAPELSQLLFAAEAG
jgi:hypothetical protein